MSKWLLDNLSRGIIMLQLENQKYPYCNLQQNENLLLAACSQLWDMLFSWTYAKKELGLDEEYEFLQYEDKGLSGYFSDRPDFQRMLHDVQDGKIKAIVCYKLDRVGRKTADLASGLLRLVSTKDLFQVNNGLRCRNFLMRLQRNTIALTERPTHCWRGWRIVLTVADDWVWFLSPTVGRMESLDLNMFVPVIEKRNVISRQWMAFFWMNLWYSSYLNYRMKTASVL